ncbi:amine sulfotransferase-like isoform X2 [Mugil cephalus]|uniref:amine sulfotransferase-like isoform X2 n=1 Tax=Mugil cephalus TaxID=48193 RepID=UPI001FB7F4FD|nr:amine sulfotransferase-like isoform X2 [Mugil cephalus]
MVSSIWRSGLQISVCVHSQNQVEDVSNRMRVPWLEGMSFNNVFRESHDPRMFRTHVFPDLLPKDVKAKKIKVVYVMRNPKDVLVSLYHFTQSWIQLESVKTFGDIFWDFLEDNAPGGSWFDHVLHFHREKDQMDIHFIKYEDMLMDLRGEVVKLCAFLGKDLTDEAIDHVVEMSTFKNMKTNPKANYKDLLEADKYRKPTMRKGEAGDWKNYFTVAQNEHFDKVFKERMGEFPLSFTWDLQQ